MRQRGVHLTSSFSVRSTCVGGEFITSSCRDRSTYALVVRIVPTSAVASAPMLVYIVLPPAVFAAHAPVMEHIP